MMRLISAECRRLACARASVVALSLGASFALAMVLLLVPGATSDEDGPSRLRLADLEAAGGALLPVSTGLNYASILLFTVFIALAAADRAGGTWRAALLHEPRRFRLAAAQVLSRSIILSALLWLTMVVGWLAAVALAPHWGVDTSAWLSFDGIAASLQLVLETGLFVLGFGLLGSVIGMLSRSVGIGLGVGLFWAGPVENILGDELASAHRWFPGLLLRDVVAAAPTLDPARLGLTLSGYGAVCVALLWWASRRDVTR